VLVARHETVESERAKRLQHPVARDRVELGLDHRRVHEMGERGRRIARDVETGGHGLGCGEVEAVREDRQMPEEPLLVRRQKVVGPVDRRS
jgi:hypothetical protein